VHQDEVDLQLHLLVRRALEGPHEGHDVATFALEGGEEVTALEPLVLPSHRESEEYERELLAFVARACCLVRALEPTVVRVLTEALE
jgi:hypothetical protein